MKRIGEQGQEDIVHERISQPYEYDQSWFSEGPVNPDDGWVKVVKGEEQRVHNMDPDRTFKALRDIYFSAAIGNLIPFPIKLCL